MPWITLDAQVLDRHVVVDERQILAKQGPCRGVEPDQAVVDQAGNRQGGEALRAAGDLEAGVQAVGTCQPRWASP